MRENENKIYFFEQMGCCCSKKISLYDFYEMCPRHFSKEDHKNVTGCVNALVDEYGQPEKIAKCSGYFLLRWKTFPIYIMKFRRGIYGNPTQILTSEYSADGTRFIREVSLSLIPEELIREIKLYSVPRYSHIKNNKFDE